MPVSTSVAVLRRHVAVFLRRHREHVGMTQSEAAVRSGISVGRINHFEVMRSVPPDAAAIALLELYDASESIDEFLGVLAEARKRTPSEAAPADPDRFSLYVGLEAGASRLEAYNALVLHGLVQTSKYAEALLRGHGLDLPENEVRRRLRLRVRRQDVLRAAAPPLLLIVIAQHVLEMPVGGQEVMRGQLAHLLEMAERPNVEIRVIPRDVVPHPALHGAFTIMSFPIPGDGGLVYIETRVRSLFLDETYELQEYRQVLNQLGELALSAEESSRLIDRLRKDTM